MGKKSFTYIYSRGKLVSLHIPRWTALDLNGCFRFVYKYFPIARATSIPSLLSIELERFSSLKKPSWLRQLNPHVISKTFHQFANSRANFMVNITHVSAKLERFKQWKAKVFYRKNEERSPQTCERRLRLQLCVIVIIQLACMHRQAKKKSKRIDFQHF